MKLLFDLETNGLYDTVDKLWIACVVNLDTDEVTTFSDYDKESKPISELTSFLDKATILVGHNIIQYDLPVLNKLLGWSPKKEVKLIDTMILSQVNFFARPGKHSLANLAKLVADTKGEKPDFSKYSDEMMVYAKQDVLVNAKVYRYLTNESKRLIENRPIFKNALELEHKIAKICSKQIIKKWKFNVDLAKKHYEYLTTEMKKIEDEINPQLKPRKVWIDTEPKLPRYTKNGWFTVSTAKMLSQFLGKEIGVQDTKLWKPNKPFQRHEMIEADIGNMQQVRLLLLDAGWKPSQYTPKGEPKITEDSVGTIEGELGKKVLLYYSMRSRHSVIKGWLELAEQNNGRVYVEAINCGTPTFRQRHNKVVNVPAVHSYFGKEMRELFMADEGKIMIGCDSSGNQIRALAHYLNNKSVNDHILNGDIHQHNADIIGIDRITAKAVLYATIFGAGNAKVGKTMTGHENAEKGSFAKAKLFEALPGLKELLKRLNSFYGQVMKTSDKGYIPGLDGRKIFAESNFKLLNYLLQAYEAVTVKTAIVGAFEEFDKRNMEVDILGMIHDEVQVQCNPEDADEVMKILKWSFSDYITEKLKLNIKMDGEPKKGINWYETH